MSRRSRQLVLSDEVKDARGVSQLATSRPQFLSRKPEWGSDTPTAEFHCTIRMFHPMGGSNRCDTSDGLVACDWIRGLRSMG